MFWPRREGAMLYLNILWVNKCAIPINVFSHFQNNAMWYVAIVLSVTKSVTIQTNTTQGTKHFISLI